MSEKYIWVFHGAGGRFSSGVFESKKLAESWISNNKLQGVLTKYPVNKGVYDWAIEKGYFKAKKEEHSTPGFMQKFTTGSQEHYHYEDD